MGQFSKMLNCPFKEHRSNIGTPFTKQTPFVKTNSFFANRFKHQIITVYTHCWKAETDVIILSPKTKEKVISRPCNSPLNSP